MMYPFMTLNDNTEIVHSESIEKDGKEQVEVRIEKPVYGGFHSATCWLPEYRWENIEGFNILLPLALFEVWSLPPKSFLQFVRPRK